MGGLYAKKKNQQQQKKNCLPGTEYSRPRAQFSQEGPTLRLVNDLFKFFFLPVFSFPHGLLYRKLGASTSLTNEIQGFKIPACYDA